MDLSVKRLCLAEKWNSDSEELFSKCKHKQFGCWVPPHQRHLFALVESAMAGEKACFFCGEEPSNKCSSCQVSQNQTYKKSNIKIFDDFSTTKPNCLISLPILSDRVLLRGPFKTPPNRVSLNKDKPTVTFFPFSDWLIFFNSKYRSQGHSKSLQLYSFFTTKLHTLWIPL